MDKKPEFVYARKPDHHIHGRLTGGSRPCSLESCGGEMLAVRWPDGKLTYPCTGGMFIRKDGDWQIE